MNEWSRVIWKDHVKSKMPASQRSRGGSLVAVPLSLESDFRVRFFSRGDGKGGGERVQS